MGRNCRICGRSRPNENFGGKGLRAEICMTCRRLPKTELQRIQATDEVYGFLTQSNISSNNIERLQQLASIEDSRFQELRTLVLEVAKVLPRKRRRWKTLSKQFPELFRLAVESQLVEDLLDEAGVWPDDDDDRFDCDIDEINL